MANPNILSNLDTHLQDIASCLNIGLSNGYFSLPPDAVSFLIGRTAPNDGIVELLIEQLVSQPNNQQPDPKSVQSLANELMWIALHIGDNNYLEIILGSEIYPLFGTTISVKSHLYLFITTLCNLTQEHEDTFPVGEDMLISLTTVITGLIQKISLEDKDMWVLLSMLMTHTQVHMPVSWGNWERFYLGDVFRLLKEYLDKVVDAGITDLINPRTQYTELEIYFQKGLDYIPDSISEKLLSLIQSWGTGEISEQKLSQCGDLLFRVRLLFKDKNQLQFWRPIVALCELMIAHSSQLDKLTAHMLKSAIEEMQRDDLFARFRLENERVERMRDFVNNTPSLGITEVLTLIMQKKKTQEA